MKNLKQKDIDAFISGAPSASRVKLTELRTLLKKLVPEAEETIAYGIPTLRLNGNLVHFSGYRHHIGFYPGADAIAYFKQEIAQYPSAKGSVQFPLDEPLPVQLITRMVQFRVKQQMTKSKPQKGTKKICPQGHAFLKTSDCPTCPVCEKLKKPQSGLYAHLSAPARRALENGGIHEIKDFSKYTKSEVLAMHGIGMRAIQTIEKLMAGEGIQFIS